MAAYDICHHRRLRRVAKVLEDYGRRVQKSVFEMNVGPVGFRELRRRVERELDPREDGVKYYPLCGSCLGRVWSFGVGSEELEQGAVLVL